MKNIEKLKEQLLSKKINPSSSRVNILAYLQSNKTHPTVDRIYMDLREVMPSLSKATVYNTVNLLAEAGLIKTLEINVNESRYDIEVFDHGHFLCCECGEIYNFKLEMEDFQSDDLEGFVLQSKDVYFKGICPKCRKTNKEIGNDRT